MKHCLECGRLTIDPSGYCNFCLSNPKSNRQAERDNCGVCNSKFSILLHRYYCKNCGACICDNCSKDEWHFAAHSKQRRVCKPCYTQLSTGKNTLIRKQSESIRTLQTKFFEDRYFKPYRDNNSHSIPKRMVLIAADKQADINEFIVEIYGGQPESETGIFEYNTPAVPLGNRKDSCKTSLLAHAYITFSNFNYMQQWDFVIFLTERKDLLSLALLRNTKVPGIMISPNALKNERKYKEALIGWMEDCYILRRMVRTKSSIYYDQRDQPISRCLEVIELKREVISTSGMAALEYFDCLHKYKKYFDTTEHSIFAELVDIVVEWGNAILKYAARLLSIDGLIDTTGIQNIHQRVRNHNKQTVSVFDNSLSSRIDAFNTIDVSLNERARAKISQIQCLNTLETIHRMKLLTQITSLGVRRGNLDLQYLGTSEKSKTISEEAVLEYITFICSFYNISIAVRTLEPGPLKTLLQQSSVLQHSNTNNKLEDYEKRLLRMISNPNYENSKIELIHSLMYFYACLWITSEDGKIILESEFNRYKRTHSMSNLFSIDKHDSKIKKLNSEHNMSSDLPLHFEQHKNQASGEDFYKAIKAIAELSLSIFILLDSDDKVMEFGKSSGYCFDARSESINKNLNQVQEGLSPNFYVMAFTTRIDNYARYSYCHNNNPAFFTFNKEDGSIAQYSRDFLKKAFNTIYPQGVDCYERGSRRELTGENIIDYIIKSGLIIKPDEELF